MFSSWSIDNPERLQDPNDFVLNIDKYQIIITTT
jgi:hypothetical protein